MASDAETKPKRLRSSEPDLKVILGSNGIESIQMCHSQTLASKSNYIDTLLSTPMKERESLTITFPDISPETWDSMMKFLDSPIAIRQMKAKDVLDVALFYDKYEFREGSKLCHEVLLEYFSSLKEMEKTYTLNLDLVIDLAIVAHRANLDAPFRVVIQYIWDKLQCTHCPYGRAMFSEEHMTKLMPLLKYSLDSRLYTSTPYLLTGQRVSLEDNDFPKQFVSACHRWEENDLLNRSISHIELCGSWSNADGDFAKNAIGWIDEYAAERADTWARRTVTFRIKHLSEEDFKGWAIVRRYPATRLDEFGDPDEDTVVEKRCWIVPYSKDRRFPPLQGWVSADPLARGNPTLRYVLRESIG